jgi:membrane peptidoglycan carboxypeptidase
LLGEKRLYDFDRLDLQVKTTLNQPAQAIVSHFLQSLATPEAVRAAGLYGPRLLRPDNDLTKVIYSFTLFEKSPEGMLLRIQSDNLNQPFDINQQARLDLGSTAKLRTMISYLQIIAGLHRTKVSAPLWRQRWGASIRPHLRSFLQEAVNTVLPTSTKKTTSAC